MAELGEGVEDEWYYTDGFERFGPVTRQDLISMYLGGMIDKETYLWNRKTKAKEWQKLIDTSLNNDIVSIPDNVAYNVREFSNCNNPIWAILYNAAILFLVFSIPILWIISGDHPGKAGFIHPSKWLFVFYISFYIGMWIVYFNSKSSDKHYKYATLRRLLLTFSMHWNEEGRRNIRNINKSLIMSEKEEMYQKKAMSGIAALAMLASASLLELLSANTIYSQLDENKLIFEKSWELTLLILAVLLAFCAFISFLVAADALETLFNKFKGNENTHKLMNHLYITAVNPRYYGFASLIGGAIFLTAIHSPLLASIVVGLVFTIGYMHWFPDKDLMNQNVGVTNIETSDLSRNIWFRLLFALGPPVSFWFIF